jgi:uncharacterized membrane protein
MPSFNGSLIFGVAVKMATQDNPRIAQLNAFFGLSGLESLDGGLQGRYTSAAGILAGGSIADLGAAEAAFRSYNDGNAYVLVDSYGFVWPQVKLESFEPQGRILTLAGQGYIRYYSARFLHLS